MRCATGGGIFKYYNISEKKIMINGMSVSHI